MANNIKKIVRKSARIAVKRAIRMLPTLPGRAGRLTGKLAKEGGLPVRDQRLRPWPNYPDPTLLDWTIKLGPTMARIFLSGEEGLPQRLANEFAQTWAKYCGARYGLLLPHGTDALRIGLAAALDHDGLEYGGEVITPNLSFIASASTALDRRLGVALVDVDPETLLLDPQRVEEAIIPGKTRAIMAVHLFGHPADMTALRKITERHSLVLVEDAAQAHGAKHEFGPVGSIGDVAGFSFQSYKNLASGEGGALTTNNLEIFERAYSIHNVGRLREGGKRWGHETLGWNCRPSEYIAAVLLHRFRTLEAEQQTRYARFLYLREQLSGIQCVKPLALGAGLQRHGAYMFPMRYRAEQCDGLSIDDFVRAIRAEGIPADRAYSATMSQQPALQALSEKHSDYVRVFPTPVADQAVKELIYLPHHLFIGSEADVREIAAAFAKVEAHYAPQTITKREPVTAQYSAPVAAVATASPPTVELGLKSIRFGIIGVGLMGQEHASVISGIQGAKLVGISDAQVGTARKVASEFGCKWFSSPEELIQSGEVEAIVIATPHWQHADLAIAGLRTGLHVVCEKPLTVTVAQADEVLRVAAESRGIFAVVHQKRFEPAYLYAKRLLESGKLGPIYRCSMVESAWRSEAYYRSSPWRGTWRGEGGGVLLNQAPHLLDRYAWLCGMPDTVNARCDTNLHKIEVEDIASAILHHANGAHGYIHISTVEAPAISRTVISCDQGRLVIQDGKMHITKLRDSIRERTAHDTQLMGDLENDTREIQISPTENVLKAFYENLVAAIAGNDLLICPGEEGRNAVELANAMMLSSARGSAVNLPLDRQDYSRLVADKMGQEVQTV